MRAAKKKADSACCTDALGQNGRLPITPDQATELMALFKVLANDTRLRLLHALALAGELCVTGLANTLGMSPQAVSNQIQRLADQRILASRRQGNTVYYRIINPCVTDLLDRGLCLIEGSCPDT